MCVTHVSKASDVAGMCWMINGEKRPTFFSRQAQGQMFETGGHKEEKCMQSQKRLKNALNWRVLRADKCGGSKKKKKAFDAFTINVLVTGIALRLSAGVSQEE